MGAFSDVYLEVLATTLDREILDSVGHDAEFLPPHMPQF
jgi:hypothetical protein